KCEVSAEAPSFHTDSRSGALLVVQMPERDPHITGMRRTYHLGDMVHVNCTSDKSKPAASLTWYINGEQASRRDIVEYMPMTDPEGLSTSTLGLRFRAREHHLQHGRLHLRCTASFAAVYTQETTNFSKAKLTHRTSHELPRENSWTTGGSKATQSDSWWWAASIVPLRLWTATT
ncbi:unnamed protein product, partial [Meganyctiphanes norvegica]